MRTSDLVQRLQIARRELALENALATIFEMNVESWHPNERAVSANLKTIEEADQLTILAVMLHGDDIFLDAALMTVARCGLNSLEMLQVIYNAKFEILGINAAMLQLRKGL